MAVKPKKRPKAKNINIRISRSDKVLFPAIGLTKGQMIAYYQDVSGFFIRYSANHPVTLHRFPNGIEGKDIYQKNVPKYFPGWIPTVNAAKKSGFVRMAMINDVQTLTYLSNQAAIAYHLWLSGLADLHRPDRMIIDLDPPDQNFETVRAVAKKIRKIYDKLGLPCYLMTTGSKGLHIATPLKRQETFEEAKDFAKKIVEYIAGQCPETTLEIRKDNRKGRVFLDYLRNAYAQTAVAPYSLRALETAPVATPILYEELEKPGFHSQWFHISNIRQRLEKGDPWEDFHLNAVSLKNLAEALDNFQPRIPV